MSNLLCYSTCIRWLRIGALSFVLVVLLLGEVVAACAGETNVQINCADGFETRDFVHTVDDLERLDLPEACESTPQTIQNFERALSQVAERVAETQWVYIDIVVGERVTSTDYYLGECYVNETITVGDVVIVYQHAHGYCVGQTDFCSTHWSVSYFRKALVEAQAGRVGNLGMVMITAVVGGLFGFWNGRHDHQLGQLFTRQLGRRLLGFLAIYLLIAVAAYLFDWIEIFEYGFIAPAMLIMFGVPQLFQPTSFGVLYLMMAGYAFIFVFVMMQIKFGIMRNGANEVKSG